MVKTFSLNFCIKKPCLYIISHKPYKGAEIMTTNIAVNYNFEPLEFRGEIRTVPIVFVRIQDIFFRASNHRLQVAVRELVEKSDGQYTMDTLNQDISRPEVQRMIKDVLQSSIGEDGEALKKKLMNEGQTKPLVLTVGNIMADGNARLLIMWLLLALDPIKYAHFSNVRCIYLPEDATEEEIDEYEIEVQLAENVKVEYRWYETANWMIAWKTQQNKTDQQVAEKFRKVLSEAKKLMKAYLEAELYLRNINKPYQFSLIDKKRTAFETLYDVKAEFALEPAKQKLIEQIAYFYIQNEAAVSERLFIYFKRIGSYIDSIENSLIEHGPKIKVVIQNEGNNHNPDSEIEDLFCSEPEPQGTEAVLHYFSQLENENLKEAIEIVDTVISHETAKEKDKQRIAKPLIKLHQGYEVIKESLVHFSTGEQDPMKFEPLITKIEKILKDYRRKLDIK